MYNQIIMENFDKDDIVLGIDLGTRFSCVSIWKDNKNVVICDRFGNRTMPSIVAFYKTVRLTGNNALSMKDVNPKNTIFDIKRIIGRKYDDPAIDLIKNLISYNIIDDQSGNKGILVQLDETDFSVSKKTHRPEEICSCILLEIKNLACGYLEKTVTKAVITVPAYFNDAQRQATLDSAMIAGLDVIKIINEPTAAALAYGIGSKEWNTDNGGNIIVYDFGAGTLDVSLMNINNGVFRVLSVGGNTHLGGEDIDYLLMSKILMEFKKENKIKNFEMTAFTQIRLKNSVETAKKILSTNSKSIICLDNFYNGIRLYYILTKEKFELICNELFILCMKPLREVLDSAGLTRDDIDDVILVGGSSKIPKIQQLILEFFSGTNIKKLTMTLNPDEVVSVGASIYGHIMTHKNDPFSENLILLDIVPLSLGVETIKKQMTNIIPRNTVIPTKKTKIFTTDMDDQDIVTIKIFEGERKLTKHNFHVGTFDLSGFEKGPRGYPIIKITFNIDINGILQITAHEKRSGAENSIRITSTWGAKGRLSKKEIENIIIESEQNDKIDTVCSMKIGYIHKINTICETILINIKDPEYHITNADKKIMKHDVKNTLIWIKNKEFNDFDLDELQNRSDYLNKKYAPFVAQINKQNTNFSDSKTKDNIADIHDDDNNDFLHEYEDVESHINAYDYDKEEVKELKKIIFELGKNIINVINNPVSKFSSSDITHLTDYIESHVYIWLNTTNACTTIEFVSKINEINTITEDIMKKYEKNIFEKNEKFTKRDELQLTCITLNNSLQSKFLSLNDTNVDELSKLVKNTIQWLLDHQNESEKIYDEKINKINETCNIIYHNMHKLQLLETENLINQTDDLSDESSEEKVPEKNKIKEDITSIINQLPDKPMPRKNNKKSNKSNGDVILEIDIDKISNTNILKFNNGKDKKNG